MPQNKSLTFNFIFNFLKTLSNVLFPVITFSYSARILGVDGVGKVNFAKSFVTYFSMIATLGMNYYGTREAAKLRDHKKRLSKFAHEMLLINGISTEAACLFLFLALLCSARVQDYTVLILINSLSVFLAGLGMEWLYQAIEEYRYIAVRSMIFQAVAVSLMLLIVREQGDLYEYTAIMVLAGSGPYLWNFVHSRKIIDFHWYGHYQIRKHLPSIFWLFALAVSIEFYTVLDATMLGLLKGDAEVGLYTAAVKINRIVNTLITSFGVVLIPRLSYYMGEGQEEKLQVLIKKAYHFIFLFSVPASIGLWILSDDIILLFSGKTFMQASFTMKLLTPIVLLIPFSVVTNQQTFVPMGKEKLILISTCTGAVTNFICNLLLIPRFAENGAAIATVIAETAVAAVCYFNAKKYLRIPYLYKGYYQYWLSAVPILVIGFLITNYMEQGLLRVAVVMTLSAVCYFGLLLFQKNQYILEMIDMIRKKTKE